MTFLKQLREAARELPFENPNRLLLLQVSDELAGRIAALTREATSDNMTRLNGAWANAVRVFKDATKPPTPPLAGTPDVDDLSDLGLELERKAA